VATGRSPGHDYRLASVTATYASTGGTDVAGVSGNPYTPAELSAAAYPSPAVVSTGNRVQSQTFGYDLHGNVLASTDDANDLWDRSLGAVTYTPNTDRLATTAGGGSVLYDASGEVSTLTTATGITFELLFDEVGRLARAVRVDPAGTMVAESYTYDAYGERVVTDKTPAGGLGDTYTVSVFDSLVLKGAEFPDVNGDYEHDDATEQVYLHAGGQRLGHAFYAAGLPSASSSNVHMFITFGDAIGSTSFVIDQGTSEVVEATTYQPYGAVDSDYRAPRWNSPREDVRYTGQWDNAEVGLVYMHARYYLPELGRFVSADPRTIQGATGDLNPYGYAAGSPFRFTDPTGLGDNDTSTPTTCNNSSCAEPQFSSGAATDVPTDQQADLMRVQQAVLAQQETKFAELQQPAAAYQAAQVQQTIGALEALPVVGVPVGVGMAVAGENLTPTQRALNVLGGLGGSASLLPELGAGASIVAGDGPAITLYHGSIDNFSGIAANGLDAARTPTWVTTDLAAAQNAIGANRVLSAGQGVDTGIITSVVPSKQFQMLQQAGGISAQRTWPGFGGAGTYSEYVLRNSDAIDLFNSGM
jgi:RHS repeat-associated protein